MLNRRLLPAFALSALALSPRTPTAARMSEPNLCPQAPPERARTFTTGRYAITGAGRLDDDGATRLVWTGERCTAWILYSGRVVPSQDERSVNVGPGGQFVAHVEADNVVEVRFDEYRPGVARYSRNGVEVAAGGADSAWAAAMVTEFIRRTGWNAALRARRILDAGGAVAVFSEARLIPSSAIRATYLLAASGAVRGEVAHARFIRDATALLDRDDGRTVFLRGVPNEWRSEVATLGAVYDAAAGIMAYSDIEHVLRSFPPPTPVPDRLRAPLNRAIDAVSAVERREAIRRQFFLTVPTTGKPF